MILPELLLHSFVRHLELKLKVCMVVVYGGQIPKRLHSIIYRQNCFRFYQLKCQDGK